MIAIVVDWMVYPEWLFQKVQMILSYLAWLIPVFVNSIICVSLVLAPVAIGMLQITKTNCLLKVYYSLSLSLVNVNGFLLNP